MNCAWRAWKSATERMDFPADAGAYTTPESPIVEKRRRHQVFSSSLANE